MPKTLASHVHVRHPDDGDVRVFGPGDQLPGWARQAITNPKAWGEDDSPSAEEYYAAQTGVAPPPSEDEDAPPAAVDAPTGQIPPGGGEPTAPAKSGRRVGAQNRAPRA